MNKQEAIKELKAKKDKNERLFELEDWDEGFKCGAGEALNDAIFIVKQLDDPEKPVLSKEEAEWVDKLTDVYDVSDALYYITRCGYGYDLTFEICGKTYELPLEDGITYGELYKLKERLVNAVIYGYEVEKEKLYLVEIPNNLEGRYNALVRNHEGTIILDCFDNTMWKALPNAKLTEEEIKEDYEWAWQFAEEVEGE